MQTSELRVTTGTAKNKRLKTPSIEGFRAVQEVAKLAVFAILEDKVIDARVLDLYSGSGNMGLEALSRGAQTCDFVDEDYCAVGVITENIKNCNFGERSAVFRKDAVKFAGNTENTYDLVFVDPFYKDTNHVFLMKCLEQILEDSGVIVFFHAPETDLNKILADTDLVIKDERRFGKSVFSLIELKK
jgi:16S rRNA (guanine966-N2)-methyltransferase